MLKVFNSLKSIELQALQALRSLLQQVPSIKLLDIAQEASASDLGIDIVTHIEVAGRRHALVCEVNASGQPRHVRTAVLRLRHFVAQHSPDAVPVFIAPYMSPEAQALCREESVGFLDLEGNTRLVFDGIYIERQVDSKPIAERRELRSLFKPKSAQVLRTLFRDPRQAWRVTELAEAAGVSLGHVSNVRSSLLGRDWARVSDDGLFLSEPDALLDQWRGAYEPPVGERLGFYTTLHGSAFEDAARRMMRSKQKTGLAAFASFSAAHWLAPYGRTGTQYFHVDAAGLEPLQSALKLSSISKGENVVATVLADPGLFRDSVEPAPGVFCTSPVQTFLDLAAAGERGQEAADHLRQQKLTWQK